MSPTTETLQAWLPYTGVGAVLLASSIAFVMYAQPKGGNPLLTRTPRSPGVTIVNIIAVFLALICVFTAPVDIFLLEHSLPHVHASVSALRTLYLVYFSFLLVHSFIGAPFAFHYARQTELIPITQIHSTYERFMKALRRTLCWLLGLAILLTMALILLLCGKPASSDTEWLKPLLHFENDAEMGLRLVMGVVLLGGMYIWVGVTSRGLASIPLTGLLMSPVPDIYEKNVQEEEEEVGEPQSERAFWKMHAENEEEMMSAKYMEETLLSKYSDDEYMSLEDEQRLAQLKQTEKRLEEKKVALEERIQAFRRRGMLAIIQIPLGVVTLVLSVAIVVSTAITTLDKLTHSDYAHGFLLNKPTFPNPLDILLVASSKWFPLDYVIFGMVATYIILVSMIALKRHGLRFLFWRIAKLRPRKTKGSTLCLVTLVLVYVSMVTLFSALTLAPQYATFGHQVFRQGGEMVPCTLAAAAKAESGGGILLDCRMSQVAHFYNTLAANVPLFGLAFCLGQLAFVIVYVPFFLQTYCQNSQLPEVDPKKERLLSSYA